MARARLRADGVSAKPRLAAGAVTIVLVWLAAAALLGRYLFGWFGGHAEPQPVPEMQQTPTQGRPAATTPDPFAAFGVDRFRVATRH